MATMSSLFVQNPNCDYPRNRKMNFESFMNFSLLMGAKSLKKELLDYFELNTDMISASSTPDDPDIFFHSTGDASAKGFFECVDLHHVYYYPMNFRIVRFKITDDSYECISNLMTLCRSMVFFFSKTDR